MLEDKDQIECNVYIVEHLLNYHLDMTDLVVEISAFEKEWESVSLENVGRGKGEWGIRLIQNTSPRVLVSHHAEEMHPDLAVQVQMNRIIQVVGLLQEVIDAVRYLRDEVDPTECA